MQDNAKLEKAIFIISLDTELAWGTRGNKKYQEHYNQKREVVNKLLALFVKYDIKATWAVVGHLFLDKCEKVDGVAHPAIISPRSDWFDVDPASDINQASEWYGKDIVAKILACPIKQEIGCHTFSHIDVPRCNRECFVSELDECQKLAGQLNLELKSFVYPKNRVAMTDVLEEKNFSCYRDRDANWFSLLNNRFKKIAHVLDNYLCLPLKSVAPTKGDGLWSLPGSYFYVHKNGWAKFLPISFRVKKVKSGINSAVKQKQIFHLWFHPFNLASDPEGLLHGLEEIFIYFKKMQSEGLIENMTMAETANYLNSKL